MSDEDILRQLFRDARPDIADAGFARDAVQRVGRMRQRRRVVLGTAAVAGAIIAVPALMQAVHALAASETWLHVGAPAINIVALCACAVSLWLGSVCVEA